MRRGSGLDRALLLKYMRRTYQEISPTGHFDHLAQTVEQYLSRDTPLWWVEHHEAANPIGCLWMGTAVDQLTGDRQAHIFLLYVDLAYRRRGIGSALMYQAEVWAHERGDRQIGLHVFTTNHAALALYEKLGYQPHSLWMVKPLL